MRYTLTAEYDGRKESAEVYGHADNMDPKIRPLMVGSEDPQDAQDGDAAMSAIPVILNRAKKSEVWAKGHIVLTSEDGRIIREMEAK